MDRWERLTRQGYIRYYTARVEKDLLGDWTVVRTWGRAGTALGSASIAVAADRPAAIRTVKELAALRLKRGYTPVVVEHARSLKA